MRIKARSGDCNYVTVVSGLPRSGTSMMMQMLEAGGVQTVIDHRRIADRHNPNGYFEFEKVKRITEDSSWFDGMEGNAIKIISHLVYELPRDRKYKVIFMVREMKEILLSQEIMLGQSGQGRELTGGPEVGKLYQRHLDEVARWLARQANIDLLYINYNKTLVQPHESAMFVTRHLGRELKIENMVLAIDTNLYRIRT